MNRTVVVIVDKGLKARVGPAKGLRPVLNGLASTLNAAQVAERVEQVRTGVGEVLTREGGRIERTMPDNNIVVSTTDKGVIALGQIEGVKGISENGVLRPAREFKQPAALAATASREAPKVTA